ncbi:hypothetical protein B0J14DRAFT_584205 [Halenospora varia]|nr:hypothetical protein B0J14DRAFT_584205 [Halenospora varia]
MSNLPLNGTWNVSSPLHHRVPVYLEDAMSTSTARTTTSITVAPLTATFTPPPPCFSQLTQNYWNISVTSQTGFHQSSWFSGGPDRGNPTSTCYPSSWASTQQYFSPGICPTGYTSGCLSTTSAETRAICCPSSWFCDTATNSLIGDVMYSKPWVAANPCAYYPSGNVSVRYGFTQFSTTSGITVNAPGISVRWKEADFVSTTSTSSTSSTSSVSTPSQTGTPATASAPSGLSAGAKAGIGVGVAVAVLGFLAALAFFILRRRRAKKGEMDGHTQEGAEEFQKPELDAQPIAPRAELAESKAGVGASEIDDAIKLEKPGVGAGIDAPPRFELAGSSPVVHEMNAR